MIDNKLLKKFDVIIKYYCELLYKWGFYTKRVEMFEFLSEKPADLDSKFGNFSLSKPAMDNTMDNLIVKLAEQYINKSRRFQQYENKSLF